MALVSPLSDYTDKDFDSLRLRLRNLVRSVFPEWTDFNVANFGNILLELFAHTGDILTFYQDNQARQSRITTATQRKALIGLVKLIGFVPATATAATADLVISLAVAPTGDVLFPKGTIVKTQQVTSTTAYQLLADALIPAGANPATVTISAENSATDDETFVSSGVPNQSVTLSNTPYIDGTLILTAANGTYDQVDNFLDSAPADRHYTLTVDQNDTATLTFGNGVNGAVPVGTITAEYKIGGGSVGRVDLNKLIVFDQTSWQDTLGNTVIPTVTNPAPSAGGTDRQSVAQIKERAPATLRVSNRTVAREDFEINALRLPAVARALMLTKNEDSSIPENTGNLYIVPVGGGAPTDALKALVLNQVTVVFPCTLTFDPNVQSAVYRVVSISCKLYFRPGVVKATAAALVRTNLATFFAPQNADGTANTNVDFGANIKDSNGNIVAQLAFSDIFNVVRDTTGVRKVGATDPDFLINGVHDDVTLLAREFPQLGTVVIVDGDTGTAL